MPKGIEKKLAAAKSRGRAMAKKAREKKKRLERTAVVGAAGYALGYADTAGYLNAIPSLGENSPKELTLAVAALGGSMFTKGKTAETLENLGDAAIAVTAAKFGRQMGGRVSGVEGMYVGDDYLVGAEDLADDMMDEVSGMLADGLEVGWVDDDEAEDLVISGLAEGLEVGAADEAANVMVPDDLA